MLLALPQRLASKNATAAAAASTAVCRYDSLLRATWARLSALSGSVAPMPPLHAVGVTLNVDRLVHVAQASSRWRAPGHLAPGGLVGSLMRAGVGICAWRGCQVWGGIGGVEKSDSCFAVAAAAAAAAAAVAGLPRLSQADVLVCSRGGGVFSECFT